MARYTTDEVMAMMQSPQPEVEVLEKPASPFLDPAQINAAERELSQPAPEVPRPDSINAPGANLLLQNYTAEEAFPVDSTSAPQRPAGGNATLYPSRNETSPNLPKPRYSTDEVISLYANESKPRLSTRQVMVEMIKPLYDPTLPRPSKEEFFKLRDIEKQLRDSGDIPSNFEETANAVGGFFVTAVDALNTALWKVDREQGLFEFGGMGVNPALAVSETWRRLPGTIAYGAEMTKQGYAAMGAGLQAMGGPKYRVKETGEFLMDEEGSAGGQFGQIDPRTAVDRYKANGLTLAPVNAEDLRDFEYQQWGQGMDRSMEVEKARTAAYPEETVYKILSNAPAGVSDTAFGTDYLSALENRPAPPMESQAVGASILADPATYISLGAGAAKIGLSAAMKGATARSLNVIGKATQRFVNPAEVPLRAMERFRKVVVSPAKVAGAYGAASGVAWAADQFELPSELKTAAFTAASLYTAYKGGLGVLRFAGKNLPEAAVILRESADATSGLDRAARQAVAANPNVPANISERLLRPSQFVSMESTPARLAQNEQLSPGTRKLMDKLSNFYVVQGVRGASAVATGSVKGGLAMMPFAEATRMAGDDRAADTMYGMGVALGALGGAGERALGARGRRVAQAESDIGRMLTDIQAGNVQPGVKRYQWIDREVGRLLTDVELAAGDVNALLQNRSFDELARTAAMQGFFRNVDYIPLNAADFELNAKEHGGSGSAGYFIKASAGERPQIFVNVEARRADVEPHEYFEAFFSSDAFSPEQKASMRAAVDQRYGADGLMARGREYAEALIKAENSKNFPNENLFVTSEQIAAKMDQLAQDELGRGGQDSLDWVRREVMVEEARMAGVDYASMRRNVPAGQNPITFIENLLGASARALGLSGVRVDPETGMAVTPEQLFKENPVAANDLKLVKQLNSYLKTYKQWLNDPQHEAPKGTRVAPDGRAESLANNPNVKFYDGVNGKENSIAFVDASGRVVEKTPKQRAKERKLRGQQVRNMVGSKILEPGNTTFGLKRWSDGRIRAGGRRLPDVMALQTHWKAHLPVIRSIEALSDAGESQQVLYFAKGNSADKVKSSRLSDIDAINREMVFDQWTTNAAGDLLAQFLDLTSVRNRAMKAIAERHPALDPANGGPGYKLQAIMDDVNQWMADKGAGKAGEATIGVPRKNVVNALINPGTNFNRSKNDLAGAFGRGSAIKTLLLEGINAVSGTGRKGAAMDYNWVNGNFMPDKPAPRPDMDSDVQAPRGMVNRQPARAQMMPDYSGRADIPLNERARRAAFVGSDGRVVSTNKRTHFETNEDLGPDFLAIGAGSISEDGFFRFGSQTMDDAMGESPREAQGMPDVAASGRGDGMPEINITPDEARRQGLVGPVYHGSPDFKGRKFDPKYRARSSGLSRGGFSFTEDVASADSYAGAGVDSAQAAVDAANDVMRDLGARMESGLKLREFADVSELPEFNVRYADDMDELASYFNDLSKRIPKDLGSRLRDAAKAINEPANPIVVEAYLRNPKEMMIDGKRLLLAENPDDIFVSAARPPQDAPSAAPRGQAMPDAGPVLSAGDADTLPVVQKLNDKGKPAMKDGKPEAASIGYDLLRAPGIVDYAGNKAEDLTKPDYDGLDYDVGPQLRKEIDAAIDSGAVDSAANRTAEFAREQMQNPEIAAGKGWYSRMREKLLSAVGEQGRELLSQLLGATSAKTPVDQNFLQAMDAYEGILAGRYEKHRQGYLEMKALESEGKLVPTILERGYVDVLRERANKLSRGAARLPRKADRTAAKSEANALRKLVNKAPEKWDPSEARAIMIEATGILPMRSNGKKFNANSRAVLKVIADDWKINRQAPKTPNFAGNLSGRTVQATIDVWAARHLRELLYKGSGKPWRIQPKSEVGVTNHDFALGQIIMQRAAKKLDMNPDDLQAILWFAEKHKWDAKGWTDNACAEKSSFDTVANLFFPEGKKPLSFDEASKMYNDMKAAEKAAKKAQDKAVKAAAAKL